MLWFSIWSSVNSLWKPFMATSRPECCDCESKEAIVDLLCHKHSVCIKQLLGPVNCHASSRVMICFKVRSMWSQTSPPPPPTTTTKGLKLVDPSYSFTDAVLTAALDKASLSEKEEPFLLKVNSTDWPITTRNSHMCEWLKHLDCCKDSPQQDQRVATRQVRITRCELTWECWQMYWQQAEL